MVFHQVSTKCDIFVSENVTGHYNEINHSCFMCLMFHNVHTLLKYVMSFDIPLHWEVGWVQN